MPSWCWSFCSSCCCVPRPQAAALPVVAVEPVQVEDVSIYGEYVGRIRAQQFVEIRARVEGYLEKMLFAEGTYIKKGQTLFIIDPTVYRARANKAKAQLNKARAQALKAERDLNRIRPLYEQMPPVSSTWITPSPPTRALWRTWW